MAVRPNLPTVSLPIGGGPQPLRAGGPPNPKEDNRPGRPPAGGGPAPETAAARGGGERAGAQHERRLRQRRVLEVDEVARQEPDRGRHESRPAWCADAADGRVEEQRRGDPEQVLERDRRLEAVPHRAGGLEERGVAARPEV